MINEYEQLINVIIVVICFISLVIIVNSMIPRRLHTFEKDDAFEFVVNKVFMGYAVYFINKNNKIKFGFFRSYQDAMLFIENKRKEVG